MDSILLFSRVFYAFKVGILDKNDHFTYYEAKVLRASDYYPFGWEMPNRKYSDGDEYRFGFNGKEDDGDWGTQNIQDYGFRLYNPSIAKFLSVDPLGKSFPYYTPYQFAGNKPIWAVDMDGLEDEFYYYITYF